MTAIEAKELPKLIPITFGSFVDVRGAPAANPFGIAIVRKKLAELEIDTDHACSALEHMYV
jgi:hypothetical protein